MQNCKCSMTNAGPTAPLVALSVLLALFLAPGLALVSDAADVEAWTPEIFGDDDTFESDDVGILGFDANEYFAEDGEDEEGADDEPYENFVPQRRRLVIRELTHNADWDTDPTALPAFIGQYKRRTGLDAYAFVPRVGLDWSDPEIFEWPMLYITGHNAFTITDEDAASMNRYMTNGGFLFVEDCLYGFPFGKAAHSEFRKVFPELTFDRIDHTDDVFSNLYGMKYSWPKVNEAGLPDPQRPHFWEAIFLEGRIAALYTPQDIGCHWEISSPPTPSNPLGGAMHNLDRIPGLRETAYCLGVNIMLYVMTH